MKRFLCDKCAADITDEAPPNAFELTVALGVTFYVSGPQQDDESSTVPNAKRYLDWCLACRKRAVRDAMNREAP